MGGRPGRFLLSDHVCMCSVDIIREFLRKGMPQIGTKAHRDVSEKLNSGCSRKTMLPPSSCILLT